LKRIFRRTRDEVTGEWKRLHKEELNDIYPSPNNVRVKDSRRMKWAKNVARMGEEREFMVFIGCTGQIDISFVYDSLTAIRIFIIFVIANIT